MAYSPGTIGRPRRRPALFALLLGLALLPSPARAGIEDAFVPLESWVYPALDRLAALGFIPSQITGQRPWSRAECRRQTREAAALLERREDHGAELAIGLIQALDRELDTPAAFLVVESLYTRQGAIAGPALNDSFHFGQTWRDDMGRPFGQGWNRVAGLTARFGRGIWFGNLRAEYQGAPDRPEYPLALRQAISVLDRNPVAPTARLDPVNRLRLVEGELGVQWKGWRLSAGRQSLYWGPGDQSPLSFSNNAEPTLHARLATPAASLPGPLRRWGTVRAEFAMGKLGGHAYTWRPWFNAQKLTFKFRGDLEFGFTRWSLLFGVGHPITWRNLFRNFGSITSGDSQPFDPRDPGDRKGGVDFRWRVAGLRQWLTVYSDTYSDDDISPLANPGRAAFSPGLWLTRVPWVPRLDLRIEAASTRPLAHDYGGQYTYFNNQYHSGNTNYGFLLGNPVGRDGRAIEAKSSYWLSPRDRIQAGYRQTKISAAFLPGGGTQTDASVGTTLHFRQDWTLSAMLQFERYNLPLLGPARQNWSTWVRLAWEPEGGYAVLPRH